MKITRKRLRSIIKEELSIALDQAKLARQEKATAARGATKIIPKHSKGIKIKDPDGNVLGVEDYEDKYIPDHRPDLPAGTLILPDFTVVVPEGESIMTNKDYRTHEGPKEIKAEDLP